MSRTYRRRYDKGTLNDWSFRSSIYNIYDYSEEEINRLRSIYHSDSFDCSFKEPGPSWYRNLVDERPARRKNKQELRKFLLDPEYEPMCIEKCKLKYWT